MSDKFTENEGFAHNIVYPKNNINEGKISIIDEVV